MKDSVINIEVLGDHHIWKSELNEIKEEITKFENMLSTIDASYSKLQVEHFQNQFIIQKKAIADIKNKILKHDLHVDREDDTIFGEVNDNEVKYHQNIEESVNRELQIYKGLKDEFLQFIK